MTNAIPLNILAQIIAGYLAASAVILVSASVIAYAARLSPRLHVWLSRQAGYADYEISMEGF